MGSISKYEATGIFISIAVMAVILALFRFQGSADEAPLAQMIDADSQGALVVAGDDTEGDLSGIRDALLDASTSNGELRDLVVDDVLVGSGPEVEVGDTVVAHYIGSTQNGVQFDNSYLRGEPFEFTIGEGKVIEGWEQGLIGMQKGGQRILVIPPDMAYGNLSVGPIEPNSTLVFAIELVEIK